ncbi:uncharacterized protein LOC120073915 [Benincasa hispida]|uniref:uncharacterized protein LOC120073915 n=1 Tax=Benincasa hispida TaxID=102211 RepID=UPI001901DE53|nr:uncharacterized protein LOC120073915 [Benincasa hispida]
MDKANSRSGEDAEGEAMEAISLHRFLASKPPLLTINPHKLSPISHNQIFFPSLRHHRLPRIKPINATDTDGDTAPPPVQPAITPPETVEVRFRKRSRRRPKQEREDGGGGAMGNGRPRKAPVEIGSNKPKKWEEMSVGEKAMEVYMGEKGLLFWLNKFAYASIFIMIGGWVLFRFVGPSLNLYQLDTPPLSPTAVFKG